MKSWQGILISVGIVVAALVIYHKFVAGKIGATSG